jgi:hypothetical protein
MASEAIRLTLPDLHEPVNSGELTFEEAVDVAL